jgi:hypothetical protein
MAQEEPHYPHPESEPNDHAGMADTLIYSQYGAGDISPVGDIDWWVREGWGVVDGVVFAFADTSTSSNTDSELSVFADDGTTLIEYDDDDGPLMSSCVAGAVIPQDGDVYLRLSEYQNNSEISPYALYLMVSPVSYGSSELEPNNDSIHANQLDDMLFMTGSSSRRRLRDAGLLSENELMLWRSK